MESKYLLIGLVVLGVFLFGCAGAGATAKKSDLCEGTVQDMNSACHSRCANIGDASQDMKDFCEEQCDNNYNLKGDLAEIRNHCYESVATRELDVAYCRSIQVSPEEEQMTNERSICIQMVAANKKDPSICEQITLQFDKDTCFKEVAVESYDDSICSRISSTQRRGECIVDVGKG